MSDKLSGLTDEAARLAWAEHLHHAGDPLGGFVIDSLRQRAWERAGRQGRLPEPVGPRGERARAVEERLIEGALALCDASGQRLVDACAVRGGLVESVSTDAARWCAGKARILAHAPVVHLELSGPVGDLFLGDALSGLIAVDLRRTDLDLRAALDLAKSPSSSSLRWLALPALPDEVLAPLAASPWLLDVSYTGLVPARSLAETLEAIHGPRPWLRQPIEPSWELLTPLPRVLRRLRFQQLRHSGPDASSPPLTRGRPQADGAAVADYLRRSPIFVASPGRVRDVFDPSLRAGSASLRTDGVYAWNEDLAHYVERWHVSLPEGLLAHGRQLGWAPPIGLSLRTFS